MERKEIIVIIGASYAGGWTPEKIRNMEIVNKGINGNQSFEMLSRFQKDVLELNPKVVIIWGFINDIFRSRQENIENTLAQSRRNIEKMVNDAKNHGIIPVLATEVTIRGKDTWSESIASLLGRLSGKESYQKYVNGHVLETNKWIKEFGKENNIVILDFQPVLSTTNNERKKEYATPDGSHISLKGYERLTEYSREALSVLFKGKFNN